MVYYFTSITVNYMAKARVLCNTLKRYNPNVAFILALADPLPDFVDLGKEPFDHVIPVDSLDSIGNKNIFFFKHTVTELCTAVKPFIALEIIKRYRAEKVIYLDPDIAVFSELKELELLLDNYSMIFTPHQMEPEDDDTYIRSNEILFLKRGTYNLGFFAVKADKEGIKFLNWWSERTKLYCFDDDYELLPLLEKEGLLGMFTDQKWIDLVPAFFDNYYFLKDPGYNVCTWNMTRRVIKTTENEGYLVNGRRLKFFHFSGFDSKGHHNEMQRACIYNPENKDAVLLTKWYEKQLETNGQKLFETFKYPYTYYTNGVFVQNRERKIFHVRKDIYKYFDNPFEVSDAFSYYNWVRKEYSEYLSSNKKPEKSYPVQKNGYPGWINKNVVDRIFPHLSKRRAWAKIIYAKLKK